MTQKKKSKAHWTKQSKRSLSAEVRHALKRNCFDFLLHSKRGNQGEENSSLLQKEQESELNFRAKANIESLRNFDESDLDFCHACSLTHFTRENPIVFCENEACTFASHNSCLVEPLSNLDEQYFCNRCTQVLSCVICFGSFLDSRDLIYCHICQRIGHKECFKVDLKSIAVTGWKCASCICVVCGQQGDSLQLCQICCSCFHLACNPSCPNQCSKEVVSHVENEIFQYSNFDMENDDDFLNEQDEDTVDFRSSYQMRSAHRLSLNAGTVQCRVLTDISRLYYGFKIDPSRCHIFYASKWHLQTSGLDIFSIWPEL